MRPIRSIKLYKIHYMLKKGRPIWTVFLLYLTLTKRLSIFEAMILNTTSGLAAAILEVPSGYLAEIIGYKKIILIGEFCSLIGFILIYLNENFYILALAYVIGGISEALISGTDEALIYSYFKLSKNEGGFKTFTSDLFSKSEFISACITLSSGYLFFKNNDLPMLVSICMMILGVIIASFLDEVPGNNQISIQKPHFSNIRRISILSPQLKRLMVLYVLFFLTVSNVNYTVSTYLQSISFDIRYLGVLLFLLKSVTSVGAWINKNNDFSLKKLFILYYSFIMMISFSHSIFLSVPILFLLRLMNGIIFPSLRADINKHIDENRAFMLSIQSFIVSLSSAIFDPLFGKSVDLLGYTSTYRILVGMFIFASLYCVFIGTRILKTKSSCTKVIE